MKVWQCIKRRPRLTARQRLLQEFMPIGYLTNRPTLLRPIVAQGEIGRIEGFRMAVSEGA